MQFTGEMTAGAVGIIISIVSMSVTGIATMLGVFMKTRTDIFTLKLAQSDIKTDIAKIEAKQDIMSEHMKKQDLMLERISTRMELMGAISNLPMDLAAAMHRLTNQGTKD